VPRGILLTSVSFLFTILVRFAGRACLTGFIDEVFGRVVLDGVVVRVERPVRKFLSRRVPARVCVFALSLSLTAGLFEGLIISAIRAVRRDVFLPSEGSFFVGASGRSFEATAGPEISGFLCIITRFARPVPLRSEPADFRRPRLWTITGPRTVEERNDRTVDRRLDGAITDLRVVLVFR